MTQTNKFIPPPTDPNDHKGSTQGDTFPMQGISRLKKVCMITGLSKSTIYAWVKAGKFPAPIKLSPSVTAWRNSDVLAWIAQLEQTGSPNNTPYHSTIKH